jgi:DNA-binding response OmpR family regulator
MVSTILVVDDDEGVTRLISDYLNASGLRVITAGNGREALAVANREELDLVLLDVIMPEMDGYEFLRRFRREHSTPVIMLTAKTDANDIAIGLELGADDYVTKPFSVSELRARVRAKLRRADQNLIISDEMPAKTLGHDIPPKP